MAKAIPIEAAKRIAVLYGYDQIVIMARKTGDEGLEHVTTFGVTPQHCEIAKRMGMVLKHDIMGWPKQNVNLEPMQTIVPDMISIPSKLLDDMKEVLRISDRKHDAWDRAKATIAKIEGA